MNKVIELHVRKFGGQLRRISVPFEGIRFIRECNRGTKLGYSCKDQLGYFFYLHCIESYDEVMALINNI